jgi:hypoxanthine phosphoribosyltransferase
MNRVVSYTELHNLYIQIIRQMAQSRFVPDLIVAPMRGGADIGIKLSQYFDCDIIAPTVQFRDREPTPINFALPDKYADILIVDDIVDSGKTILELAAYIKYQPTCFCVKSAAAFVARDLPVHVDFVGEWLDKAPGRKDEGVWLDFPWECWWNQN